jgi:hypothetical protein
MTGQLDLAGQVEGGGSVMHKMVYGIAAETYSDLAALAKAGIIDFHLVQHGGGITPSAQFPKDCIAVGGSPVLNNGNDGGAGWDGTSNYYKNVAALGYMAAGGESEQAAEIDSIMDNLTFLDYGGEGTGGGTNDDVWNVTHPASVHGFGAVSYLETYDSATNLWGWNVMGSGMRHALLHGVKEIGLLVGNWMINHSSAQDYVNIANQMEANGITCSGIVVWAGYGSNMNSLYSQFAPWFQAWQAIWPPETRTLGQRLSGTPAPVSKVTVASEIFQITSGLNTDKFVIGSDKSLWWKRNTGPWLSLGGTAFPGTMPMADYVNGVLEVHVIGVTPTGTIGADWVRRMNGLSTIAASWTPWAQDELNLN